MAEQDEDFAAMFEASQGAQPRKSSQRLRVGQSVQGVVIQVGSHTLFVDVGAKAEARIDREQLCDARGQLTVGVGDTIRATVAKIDRDGPLLVKNLGRGGGVGKATIEIAYESKAPIEGTVTGTTKGGLTVEIAGIRAFCPASQADITYQPNFDHLIDQKLQFQVTEIRDGGRSVVVSRKAVLADERRQQGQALRDKLEVGAELTGTVRSIQPYGAFIDLGGLEGLCHVSQLGHGRVDRVEDVLSVGESVKVRVLAMEPRPGSDELKISLTMRAQQDVEAQKAAEKVMEATVAQVTAAGVLVDTPIGRGIVPNRELGLPHGGDARRAFPMGKKVEVVVLNRDTSSGKLRLSIKGVADAEARQAYRSFKAETKKATRGKGKGFGSLGDLLRDKLPEAPTAPKARSKAAPKAKAKSAAKSGQKSGGKKPAPSSAPRKRRRKA